MNLLSAVILMSPAGEGGEGGAMNMLFLPLIIVVFYFFMIRPQVKRQKEMKNFRAALAKGDKIVTTGGIYGKITAVDEAAIKVDVGNSIILKVDKNAVLRDPAELEQSQRR